MATAIRSIKDAAINAWDWPDIPRAKYRERDRRRLKSRSQLLSVIGGIVMATFSVSDGHLLPTTLGLSTIGILVGHYLAGVITELERRQRARQSQQD